MNENEQEELRETLMLAQECIARWADQIANATTTEELDKLSKEMTQVDLDLAQKCRQAGFVSEAADFTLSAVEGEIRYEEANG